MVASVVNGLGERSAPRCARKLEAMATIVVPCFPPLTRKNAALSRAPQLSYVSTKCCLTGAKGLHFLPRSNRQEMKARSNVKAAAQANQAAGDLMTEDASVVAEETCEIVQGSNVTIGEGEGDGAFQAYLIQAIKNNNGVGVLFLTDVHGFEDGESRDFAYRLACFGYNVLVPDLFRGVPWRKENPQSDYEAWRELHSLDRVAEDIDLATKYLFEEISAEGKLAVIGFCYGGGRLIETLARDADTRFAVGAFLYGTRFNSSLATQIKTPLLLIAGDADDKCSTETIHQLEKQVKGSKAKIYPGFGHAFAHHPSSSEEDEAAEDAFTEVRHWFHDHLLLGSAETV